MESIRILEPGDEALVAAFCARLPDTTLFFMNNMLDAGLEDHGRRFQGTYAAAFEGDSIVALAAHFWNDNIILEAPTRLEDVVRAAAQASGREVAQLVGPYDQALAARAALGLAGVGMRLDSREILYALELSDLRVPAALLSGRHVARLAGASDLARLLPWRIAYRIEALGEVDTPELRAAAEQGVGAWLDSGRMWVLEVGGRIVSTTGFNAVTPAVVQIGGVWTPPEQRSQGYARSAVAGSLLDARARGVTRSILFTPEDNLAAQACYRGLGYREIGDYGLLMLSQRHRPFG